MKPNIFFVSHSSVDAVIGANVYAYAMYDFLGKHLQLYPKESTGITQPMSVDYISEYLGISHPKAYSTIKYLISKGLIERIRKGRQKYHQFRLVYTKEQCDALLLETIAEQNGQLDTRPKAVLEHIENNPTAETTPTEPEGNLSDFDKMIEDMRQGEY